MTPTWGEPLPVLCLPLPDQRYGYSRRARVKRAVYALRQHRKSFANLNFPGVSAMREAVIMKELRAAIAERNG